MIQEFHYNSSNDKLIYTDYVDRNGKLLNRLQYSGDRYEEADLKSKIGTASTLASNYNYQSLEIVTQNFYLKTRSQITHIKYMRDNEGVIKKLSFMNGGINKQCNSNNVFSCRFDLDKLGRISKVYYLYEEDKVKHTKKGMVIKEYCYDSWGNISRVTCKDIHNQLTLNHQNWAILVRQADKNGNVTKENYLDRYECNIQTLNKFCIEKR